MNHHDKILSFEDQQFNCKTKLELVRNAKEKYQKHDSDFAGELSRYNNEDDIKQNCRYTDPFGRLDILAKMAYESKFEPSPEMTQKEIQQWYSLEHEQGTKTSR